MSFHLYSSVKALHLISLAFWMGPAFGAYWILLRMSRSADRQQTLLLEKYYEQVVRAEHVFFISVLVTGLTMIFLSEGAWLALSWMRLKLGLVALIILGEGVDIWLAHFCLGRLIKSDQLLSSPQGSRALKLRKRFYLASLPVFSLAGLAIIYLSVLKPS